MAMSRYCLASWRDVFGEMYVGLKRLGVIDAFGRNSYFITRAEGYNRGYLIRVLVAQPNLYLRTLNKALYIPAFAHFENLGQKQVYIIN